MAKTYRNIPVEPDVYAKVELIADLTGRGLGAQVKAWTEQVLPSCGHPKFAVTVEVFEDDKAVVRKGLYCETCKRVYDIDPDEVKL